MEWPPPSAFIELIRPVPGVNGLDERATPARPWPRTLAAEETPRSGRPLHKTSFPWSSERGVPEKATQAPGFRGGRANTNLHHR